MLERENVDLMRRGARLAVAQGSAAELPAEVLAELCRVYLLWLDAPNGIVQAETTHTVTFSAPRIGEKYQQGLLDGKEYTGRLVGVTEVITA